MGANRVIDVRRISTAALTITAVRKSTAARYQELVPLVAVAKLDAKLLDKKSFE